MFQLARVCAVDGGRIAMATYGEYRRHEETTLTLYHMYSSCPAQIEPGDETVLTYEKPNLILPLNSEQVVLSYEPVDPNKAPADAGTITQGCFEADGGFTPRK
jgi:hypothetical protein